jgi:hypothetical protein
LDATTSHAGELEELISAKADSPKQERAMLRAVSLPGRAAVMRDLAQATKTWVGLERQAFSIVEDDKDDKPKREPETLEELRLEILHDIVELGILPESALPPELLLPPAPQGIANRTSRRGNGTAH